MIIDVVDLEFKTLNFNRRYDSARYRRGKGIYNKELVTVKCVNKIDEKNIPQKHLLKGIMVLILQIIVHKEVTLKRGRKSGQAVPESIEIKVVFLSTRNSVVKLELVIKL